MSSSGQLAILGSSENVGNEAIRGRLKFKYAEVFGRTAGPFGARLDSFQFVQFVNNSVPSVGGAQIGGAPAHARNRVFTNLTNETNPTVGIDTSSPPQLIFVVVFETLRMAVGSVSRNSLKIPELPPAALRTIRPAFFVAEIAPTSRGVRCCVSSRARHLRRSESR